jgi:hypothetical protein
MSNLVQRRERIARVRRVEHVLAAGAAAAADAQLQTLEQSAARVLELRLSLTTGVGNLTSQTLAAQGELAHRLDLARFGLADAIVGARATVAAKSAERLDARIRQESAERLAERAGKAADILVERRAAAQGHRPPRDWGDAA